MSPRPPMHALTGECLLAACEQAQGEHPLLRPLTLLAAAMPTHDRQALLELPLGARDRLLLELRRLSFGPTLRGYASCPQCGTGMEFGLEVAEALQTIAATDQPTSVGWHEAGMDLQLRQAPTADLLACARTPMPAQAVRSLLARCLGVSASSVDTDQRVDLPSVRAHFDRLHADSEWRCVLRCPQCTHEDIWNLDIGDFIWIEARHAARRLLTDIHTLAMHYGWSEPAIAALSQQRRDAYLELLGA